MDLRHSAAQAVLTMTQNIIQEQKDEARRIVEEQVACYIGRLEAAVGTMGRIRRFAGA
jgi:hypothetical protein